MKIRFRIILTGIALMVLLLQGCRDYINDTIPEAYQLIRPDYFPNPIYNFGNNVYSKDGFELGRKLFYDPILSIDGTISCGSCHKQSFAFADAGLALSFGVEGRTSTRNSPPMFNLAWNPSFMWDGGVNHLEIMPLAPITNHVEMADTLPNILAKLRQHSEYPQLFREAFGKEQIDDQQLFWALAQFMANMVSADSKYDSFRLGKVSFSSAESAGYQLFQSHCQSCHTEPLFTNFSFQNNGLDSVFIDEGRYGITLDNADKGKFKVPSLRNVELTAPYMHDGRFSTLEEILEHYSNGIRASETLAEQLSSNGFYLSNSDKINIITFLKTLTDYKFIEKEIYNP